MAPEVPGGTRRPLVMSRGGLGLKIPMSVLHVSALTAAMAPTKAMKSRGLGLRLYRMAKIDPKPPLARGPLAQITCAGLSELLRQMNLLPQLVV